MNRDFSRNPGSLGQIKCVIPIPTGTLIPTEFGVIYRNKKQQEVIYSWDTFNKLMFNNFKKPNVK